MNAELHAVTDALGLPLQMALKAGQRRDYFGAPATASGKVLIVNGTYVIARA